jgi:hypothetical protein
VIRVTVATWHPQDYRAIPELGVIPLGPEGLLVDDKKLSPEAGRALLLADHLIINGLDIDRRLGRPPTPRPLAGGNATNTMLSAGAYQRIASVIPGAAPEPGKVIQ